jgi:hypothetical protein
VTRARTFRLYLDDVLGQSALTCYGVAWPDGCVVLRPVSPVPHRGLVEQLTVWPDINTAAWVHHGPRARVEWDDPSEAPYRPPCPQPAPGPVPEGTSA